MGISINSRKEVNGVKKSFLFFVIVAVGTLSLILSGCFQMQTTISYDSYIQATPFSSITHVYIFLKSINANGSGNSLINSTYNGVYDLVPSLNVTGNFYAANPISGLQSLAFSGNGPFSIDSLSINIGPAATIVLGNGDRYTVPVSTSITVPFYDYTYQKMQQAPLQINAGQNKTALILWDLSGLSTSTNLNLSAKGFDMSNLISFSIIYKASNVLSTDPQLYPYTNGTYPTYPAYRFARINDFGKTYNFTAQGYWNALTDAYDFTLYPFAAPTSSGYLASYSINSATETFLPSATDVAFINSVTINATDVMVTPNTNMNTN